MIPALANKQTRRRPAEVRRLLLAASREVFAERGYANATVEEIIAAAGVSASVYYRNFRTKGALFGEAVLEPFVDFLEDFRPAWEDTFRRPYGPEEELELTKRTMRYLYQQLKSHSDVLVALVSADGRLDPEGVGELRARFTRIFAEMRSWGEVTSKHWSPPGNLELTDRLIMSMVSGLVVFEPWYLPTDSGPVDAEELIDHMARLFLYGIRLTPPTPRNPATGGAAGKPRPTTAARRRSEPAVKRTATNSAPKRAATSSGQRPAAPSSAAAKRGREKA